MPVRITANTNISLFVIARHSCVRVQFSEFHNTLHVLRQLFSHSHVNNMHCICQFSQIYFRLSIELCYTIQFNYSFRSIIQIKIVTILYLTLLIKFISLEFEQLTQIHFCSLFFICTENLHQISHFALLSFGSPVPPMGHQKCSKQAGGPIALPA